MSKRPLLKTMVFSSSLWALLVFLWAPGHSMDRGNEMRILETGAATMVVEVVTGDYQVEPLPSPEEGYARITAPGYGYTAVIGKPLLPATGFLVGIPLQGAFSVLVLEEEWTTMKTGPSARFLCPAWTFRRLRVRGPGDFHPMTSSIAGTYSIPQLWRGLSPSVFSEARRSAGSGFTPFVTTR
jgi:hypothetical protein